MSSTIGKDPRNYLRTSSLDVEGNLNFRRLTERDRYNRWLKGEATKEELGHSLLEGDGSPQTNLLADPPVWVHTSLGRNEAFMVNTIGDNIETRRNVRISGTEQLEFSEVPASGTSYYTKNEGYITKTYYLTASAGMISDPHHRADSYSSTLGLLFSASMADRSGSQVPGPAIFRIDVPDAGRLVDIKVWVEFLHQSGADEDDQGPFSGPGGHPAHDDSDPSHPGGPLASFHIALRSPNVRGKFSAFPWENDPTIIERLPQKQLDELEYSIWGSSFPLWIGRSGSSYDNDSELSTWQNNRHMRTVFWDSANTRNPYDTSPMYKDGVTSHDPTDLELEWEDFPLIFIATGSLQTDSTQHFTDLRGAGGPWMADPGDQNSLIYGSLVRIHHDGDALPFWYNDGSGSPPDGWLTGPGGVSQGFEWPTTGSNFGPETIRPAMPMLPDVIGTAGPGTGMFAKVGLSGTSQSGIVGKTQWSGFKPGLRGSQIKGEWELLVINNLQARRGNTSGSARAGDFFTQNGIPFFPDVLGGYAVGDRVTRPPTEASSWFRQFRLEFTYLPGRDASLESSLKRFNNNSSGKRQKISIGGDGYSLGDRVGRVSGSSRYVWGVGSIFDDHRFWFYSHDYIGSMLQGQFEAEIFEAIQDQPFTTVGITDYTGSTDFAVFTRLTGGLADTHGPTPYWFLGPPTSKDDEKIFQNFGTPYIPLSSGSGEDPSFDIFTDAQENATTIANTLSPRPRVRRALSLRAILSRYSVTRTTRDLIKEAADSIDDDS